MVSVIADELGDAAAIGVAGRRVDWHVSILDGRGQQGVLEVGVDRGGAAMVDEAHDLAQFDADLLDLLRARVGPCDRLGHRMNEVELGEHLRGLALSEGGQDIEQRLELGRAILARFEQRELQGDAAKIEIAGMRVAVFDVVGQRGEHVADLVGVVRFEPIPAIGRQISGCTA